MLFPLRPDWRIITTSWSHSTKYQLQLSREFWLESILIGIQFTTGGANPAATALTADNWGALLKSARMSITDASGNRKVLDVTGSALLETFRNEVGSLDKSTLFFLNTTNTAASSTSFIIWFPINFRHPQIQDPVGMATMIPLPRLNNDPILEIELGSAAEVCSNAGTIIATRGNLIAVVNRRDVLTPNFPYIPSEQITYSQQWNSAGGKQSWEIPTVGTATSILIQDYKGGTSALANRVSVLGSGTTTDEVGQDWSLEYLSTVIRRVPPAAIAAQNETSQDVYAPGTPTATLSFFVNQTGSYFMDFLTDYPGSDAFSFGSALDLNPLASNGGKAKLTGSSIVTTAGSFTNFTVRKLFGNLRDLKFV